MPASFTGPLVIKVRVGGSKKPSWTSEAVSFEKYACWDWRNRGHVYDLDKEASVAIGVYSGGKDERCAGFVFCDAGGIEGWQKLRPEQDGAAGVLGSIYVRIGPKLSSVSETNTLPSLNLEEAFPEFPEECAVGMEPAPDDSLTSARVFSLAVSLADVSRVRSFLINGGSAKWPVIIARGINGSPLEAICANCPSSVTRKKMRIEFEGRAFARARCVADAVAIAELLLCAGAKHDARSVRWLYDGAANHAGKQALMQYLDAQFYGGLKKKKKAEKAPELIPVSHGWKSQNAPATVSKAAGVQLGGTRKAKKKEKDYVAAQEALSRPLKPIPLLPDSDSDNDAQSGQTPQDKRGFFPKGDDESDDLEEESSEETYVAVPPPRQPKQHRDVGLEKSIPIQSIEDLMQDIETNSQIEERQQAEAQQDDETKEMFNLLERRASSASVAKDDEDIVAITSSGVVSSSQQQSQQDDPNESVIVDWNGVETESMFELGEEVNEVLEKEKERLWKRPPSMMFKIIRK